MYSDNQAKKWELVKQQIEDGKRIILERSAALDHSADEGMRSYHGFV